jgi:Kef-type K+ transport system membrane component KefB
MADDSFVFTVFLIFTSAAVLATLALYTRQSLLVAYMLLGILFGPSGFKLVPQLSVARDIGDIGIIFLLFLLGLDLSPKDLLSTLRSTTVITLISSLLFAAVGFIVARLFGFNVIECVLIGVALIFSSTVIGLKLLPTTALHHQRIGEILISVLLMQDLIALAVLIFIHGASMTGSRMADFALSFITLPALCAFAFLFQHYVMTRLFARFDRIKEYIFLLALGWCLGLAELSHLLGLSAEIGAFLAGVSIAEGPIALYIADSLKPLRDFCLVMFFFAVGASFDLHYLPQVWLPALLLSGLVLLVKPWVFTALFHRAGESLADAREAAVRLGQTSEFSLLVAYLAAEGTPALIGEKADYLIQAVTLITFVVSSYWVVLRYPTPVAFSDRLRRD